MPIFFHSSIDGREIPVSGTASVRMNWPYILCAMLAKRLLMQHVPPYRVCLILLPMLILMQTVQSQDLEPRSYANTPVGMNFLLLGYFYSDGDVATDPSLPLKDGHVTVNGAVTGYVRSLDMWGKSGKISAVMPYACAEGSAKLAGQPGERDICGLADPRLRLSINLYGAPAMNFEEFRSYRQDLIIGATLQVTAPYGQYDSDKLLNIGTTAGRSNPNSAPPRRWAASRWNWRAPRPFTPTTITTSVASNASRTPCIRYRDMLSTVSVAVSGVRLMRRISGVGAPRPTASETMTRRKIPA